MRRLMVHGVFLKEIVLQNDEVVNELDAQVALGLDVVLHVDQAVDLDVDGKAVASKLGRDLLVDFNEHVVRTPHDTLLAFLLADTIR